MYVDAFANGALTLRFTKATLELLYHKGEDHFGLPSFEAEDSVLDAASTA